MASDLRPIVIGIAPNPATLITYVRPDIFVNNNGVIRMYEEEILDELREMNRRLANLEQLFLKDRLFGGSDFTGAITRIVYGVEE